MNEVIEYQGNHYILAASSLADDRSRVLKQGDTFAVFNRRGDIKSVPFGEGGIYHEGTRFLSHLELLLGTERRPLLLSSNIQTDNIIFSVDLTNPDILYGGDLRIPHGTVHIRRSKLLWQGVYYESFSLWNLGVLPVELPMSLTWQADFVDIFEVRGQRRPQRGELLPQIVYDREVLLAYRGLNGVTYRTSIECIPKPNRLSAEDAEFALALQPGESAVIYLNVACGIGEQFGGRVSFGEAHHQSQAAFENAHARECDIQTSSERFNDWVNRSLADLRMLMTETEYGYYPYSGIPWYSTVFGRDGILTALELLWINPDVARGVLNYLAATQAAEINPEQDAEPGKILHETRRGEMAALNEIPFGRYYGSVDATPLFVILAGAYYERTGDRDFAERLWPHIERALHWIDTYGDADGDGFVEYMKYSEKGLVNQGWKDSGDSVFHSDGSLAEGPIALCEVQAYVYDAKLKAARIAGVLGKRDHATQLLQEALNLQRQFEQVFWLEDLGYYALALDGKKRACRVRTSNMGHCLTFGIASRRCAEQIARVLLDEKFFAGWGIRTVSAGEVRFNPMSYHNGSVWPHDNALIAYGLALYGFSEEAIRIFHGLFDVSLFAEFHRLPELWCGFERSAGLGPTLYPVACTPQAWSAGSVLMLLQACLGLSVSGAEERITFKNPLMPDFLRQIHVRDLRVGRSVVDISFERHERDVGVIAKRRKGDVEVVMIK